MGGRGKGCGEEEKVYWEAVDVVFEGGGRGVVQGRERKGVWGGEGVLGGGGGGVGRRKECCVEKERMLVEGEIGVWRKKGCWGRMKGVLGIGGTSGCVCFSLPLLYRPLFLFRGVEG